MYYEPHGRSNAEVVCKAWASKMNFLYKFWLDADKAAIAFTDEIVSTWEPPREFAALLEVPDLLPATRRRMDVVLKVKPGAWRPLDD